MLLVPCDMHHWSISDFSCSWDGQLPGTLTGSHLKGNNQISWVSAFRAFSEASSAMMPHRTAQTYGGDIHSGLTSTAGDWESHDKCLSLLSFRRTCHEHSGTCFRRSPIGLSPIYICILLQNHSTIAFQVPKNISISIWCSFPPGLQIGQ